MSLNVARAGIQLAKISVIGLGTAAITLLVVSFLSNPQTGDASYWKRLSLYFSEVVGGLFSEGQTRAGLSLMDFIIRTSWTLYLVALSGLTVCTIGVLFGVIRSVTDRRIISKLLRTFVLAITFIPLLIWSNYLLLVSREWGINVNASLNDLSFISYGVLIVPCAALALSDGLIDRLASTVELDLRKFFASSYCLALRSRGVPMVSHAARSVLPGVAFQTASMLIYLLGASLVVEHIFAIYGLSMTLYQAIFATKQFDVVVYISTAFVLITYVLHETGKAVAAWADPRERRVWHG